MSRPLTPVLSRWEIDPPLIGAEEADGDLRFVFPFLRDESLVRPAAPAGACTCPECGERCRVSRMSGPGGGNPGFIHCRCGVSPVDDEALRRWTIDTPALLSAVFRGVALSITERVPGHVWQVGKARWNGRSREVWFARCFRRTAAAAACDLLQRRPKSILFAPTEAGALRWHEATGNLALALESTLTFCAEGIGFDADYVEGRIEEAGLGPSAPLPRRAKKRGERAANIEALQNEMIQHLRAARDHAFAAKERTGEPALLPRPTRKALGERVGLNETDVSRCFGDTSARELKLYWETAADLDRIMDWKGPISTGRKA